MAGKKKGKKKGSTSPMPNIAAALIPAAMFAAVPRTPPPPKDVQDLNTTGLMTSALLNSSMLGRMFGTPLPPDEEKENHPSDPDTSLYDYEDAMGTGLYTGDADDFDNFDENPFSASSSLPPGVSGPRHAVTPRRSPMIPPEDDSEVSDNEDFHDGTYDHVLEPDEFVQHQDVGGAIYAQPKKLQQNGLSSDPAYDLTDSEDDLTNVSHDSPAPPISTSMQRFEAEDVSPRAPSMRKAAERIHDAVKVTNAMRPLEAAESKIVKTEAVEKRTSRMNAAKQQSRSREEVPSMDNILPTGDVAAVDVEPSPRLLELQQQNKQSQQREKHLQQQIQQQQEEKERLLLRLQKQETKEQRGQGELQKLLKQQQDVTDATLRQQEELIRTLQDRSSVLEQEKEELEEMNRRLQEEAHAAKKMAASLKEEGLMGSTGNKKVIQDLKDESDTLKSAVHRLNVELSRYQARDVHLSPKKENRDGVVGLPAKGPTPSWLINSRYLAPLLLAYDDRLEEKDSIIQQYQDELDSFHHRVDDIVKENKRLHLRLEQADRGAHISMTEWQQMQEQAKLVLEENQLLMEQIEVQQEKTKDMHRAHLQEVSKLSNRLVMVEAEKNEHESSAGDLRKKLSSLKQANDSLLYESRDKVPRHEHQNLLSDMKRSLDETSREYKSELTDMIVKLQSVQTEKKNLALQVTDLTAEIKQLEAKNIGQDKIHKKALSKIARIQTSLETAELKEKETSHYLNSVLNAAEKTMMERDTYAKVVHNKEKEKQKAMDKALEGSASVGAMEERLKTYKAKMTDKLKTAALRLKHQDENFAKKHEETEREMRHLRSLLKRKDELLQESMREKKQLEFDMETVWQTATKDNQRMRETVRKVNKKVHNPHLDNGAFGEDSDNQELLHLSSDSDR